VLQNANGQKIKQDVIVECHKNCDQDILEGGLKPDSILHNICSIGWTNRGSQDYRISNIKWTVSDIAVTQIPLETFSVIKEVIED
jgi:hypothetical protein